MKANLHLINTLDRFWVNKILEKNLKKHSCMHQDFAAIIFDICSIVSHNIDGLNVESQYMSAVTNEKTVHTKIHKCWKIYGKMLRSIKITQQRTEKIEQGIIKNAKYPRNIELAYSHTSDNPN